MHFRRSPRPRAARRAPPFPPVVLIATSLVVVGWGSGVRRKTDKRGPLQADPCSGRKAVLPAGEEPGPGWPRGRATRAVTQGPARRSLHPPPALPISAVVVLPFWFIFEFVLLRGGDREGDDRGGNGWMASLTQWTWVWASSGRQWRTGGLACCSPRGCKESGTTERPNDKKWGPLGQGRVARKPWSLPPPLLPRGAGPGLGRAGACVRGASAAKWNMVKYAPWRDQLLPHPTPSPLEGCLKDLLVVPGSVSQRVGAVPRGLVT